MVSAPDAPFWIPITKLSLGEEEAAAAAAVVRSGWLAMGAKVEELERAVASFVGSRFAVAVSSGTAALHLVLHGLGLGPGDEVILPSLTYIATANAIRYVGATPVFADVDRATYNLDPQSVVAALTPRSRAIVVVHQLGLPASLEALTEIAHHHHLPLIEDAACALGATYQGRPIGLSQRAACCFSFHPRKIITTGEGGMITIEDERLAQRLRVLRSQGMSIPAEQRHQATEILFEDYEELGFNYRLTDVQAAIGVEQMKKLPELLQRRRYLAARYTTALRPIQEVVPPVEPTDRQHAWQSYMIRLTRPRTRRRIMTQLLAQGIATRRGVMAVHGAPCYEEFPPTVPLPQTEALSEEGLILPLYPQLQESEQDRIVELLAQVCAA